MKLLISLVLITLSTSLYAGFNCSKYPTEANTEYLYASIESIDHMTLELLLTKKAIDRRHQVTILGGKFVRPSELSNCSGEEAKLTWTQNRFASEVTFGYNGHHAFYRICIKNRDGQVLLIKDICNEEVGD